MRSAYFLFSRTMDCLQSPLLLLIRLIWGWQFFQAGLGKLMNISNVVPFFEKLGLPFPTFNTYLVSCVECFGGLLLMAGLFSRLVSIPLAITMIVALAVTSPWAEILMNPSNIFQETPASFLCSCLVILVFGPGYFSLDYLLRLEEKN